MADENVGIYTPEDARMVLDTVRLLRSSGILERMMRTPPVLTPTPLHVHNDSGEEIPAYACMQITGTEDIDGRTYQLADKPADANGDAGEYLFNGHHAIADDREGVVQTGRELLGFKDSGTVTAGDHWAPVANQWYIAKSEGGPFVAAGDDAIDDDVLRVTLTSSGDNGGWVITPTLGIQAATFSDPNWTLGSDSCNKAETFDDGGVKKLRAISPHVSITVYSHSLKVIPGDIPIRYSVLNGLNIAHTPGIVDIRVDGPNNKLQYSVDGSTWVDWHTGTVCP